MTKNIQTFSKATGNSVKNVLGLNKSLVSAASAAVLGFFIKRQLQAADALAKTADKVGVGVEALQEYRFAADLAGVQQNVLDMAIQRFSRRIGEAAQGTGELVGTLTQYGITVTDAEGRTRRTEDVMLDLADAIKNAGSDQERLRIAFKAFDSEGAALVNLLRKGSAGLKQMRQEARDLGIVLDERMVREAEKANDQLTKMGRILSTQITRVVLSLTPEIIALGRAFSAAAPAAAKFIGSLLPDSAAPLEELETRLAALRSEALQLQLEGKPFFQLQESFDKQVLAIDEQIRTLETLIEKRRREDELLKNALDGSGVVTTDQAAKIKEITDNLQFEIDQLSRTTNGQELYNLAKSAGVTVNEEFAAKVLPLINALQKEKDAQEAAKEAAEARADRVTEVIEENKTAQEKYNDTLRELNDLKPEIGQETYARAVKAARKELEEANEVAVRNKELIDDIGLTFTSRFEEAVIAGGKLSDVLQGLADDLLQLALRQLVLKPIIGVAGGFLGGLVGGNAGDPFGGFDPTGAPTIPNFAAGGRHRGGFRVVGEQGPELEATGPSRIFSARETKAILSGDGLMAGGNVEVNVYPPPGSTTETRETAGPGGRTLDVFIDETNAKLINTPGSRTGRALRTQFGAQTTLKGR